MKLRPIDPSEIELVAGWMGKKENYQWLDFGSGQQVISAASLKVMNRRDIHLLRIFTSDADDTPVGLVALSNVDRNFGTATLWIVLGDKSYAGKGYSTRAVSKILAVAFKELGLHAVNAWAADPNTPSLRMMERNNFRIIGRQRQCHYIDDRLCDRIFLDILASEFRED